MGYSVRSIGAWIAVISFFAVIIAIANMQIQSHFGWVCLGVWFAIVLVYCLVKLIWTVVRRQKYRKRGQLEGGKPAPRKKMVPDPASLQQLKLKGHKGVGFKVPHLAGFAPDELQVSNSHRKPSPSKGFASLQQQKAKKWEVDLKLPPLAGFSPEDLQKPTKKNPRQDSSL